MGQSEYLVPLELQEKVAGVTCVLPPLDLNEDQGVYALKEFRNAIRVVPMQRMHDILVPCW
jgi:hypothetical protein